MQRDDDKQDRRQQDKRERITRAQDGYPESWSYGALGSEYRRTWFVRPWTSRLGSPSFFTMGLQFYTKWPAFERKMRPQHCMQPAY
jgi:hypothetical protein